MNRPNAKRLLAVAWLLWVTGALAQPNPAKPAASDSCSNKDCTVRSLRLRPATSPSCTAAKAGQLTWSDDNGLRICDGSELDTVAPPGASVSEASAMRFSRVRRFWCSTIGGGATPPCFGGTASLTGSTTSPLIGATGALYTLQQSTASANSGCGWALSFNQAWGGGTFSAAVRTSTSGDLAAQRHWYGFSSSALAALTPALTATASAIRFAAVARDPAVASGNWLCCAGNATNFSCSDMGSGPAAATEYLISVTLSASGVSCSAGSASGSTSTHSPYSLIASANAGAHTTQATKDAVSRNCYTSWIEAEFPG